MKRTTKFASLLILLLFPSLFSIQSLKGGSDVEFNEKQDKISIGEPKQYIIPYLKGQGLNNQMWDYRTAAIVAKIMNRVLCLEPFHRFYLQKYGREFIPFQELFDKNVLQNYTSITNKENCAIQCKKRINHYIEFSSKDQRSNRKQFSTPHWRPGSLKKFRKSTGFDSIPPPTTICTTSKCKNNLGKSLTFNQLASVLMTLKSKDCIAISGGLPKFHEEFLLWSRAIKVSKHIRNVVDEIKARIFEGRSYMAIHWRFEETKCAGVGKGIGFGRAAKGLIGNSKYIIRKSDADADLCFFGGLVPTSVKKDGIWLRLVSRKAVVGWIQTMMKERGLRDVYIATDCQDQDIMDWIKLKTGAKSKSDVANIISEYIKSEENDVTSRFEQQLCTEAEVFAGTLQSSWTGTVVEERLLKHDYFFTQDKVKVNLRPDPENQTFYLDAESCNCEW